MITDASIDRIAEREAAAFCATNPKSLTLAQQASTNWFQGVPFHWMLDWPSPAPLVAALAARDAPRIPHLGLRFVVSE